MAVMGKVVVLSIALLAGLTGAGNACGPATNMTCPAGQCCSKNVSVSPPPCGEPIMWHAANVALVQNVCGTGFACMDGCQPAFGSCGAAVLKPPTPTICGAANGRHCGHRCCSKLVRVYRRRFTRPVLTPTAGALWSRARLLPYVAGAAVMNAPRD